MNKPQRKFINFFLVWFSCLVSLHSYSSPSSEEVVDEVRLLRFENRCLSEETAQTQFCLQEYEVISNFIEGTKTETLAGHCSPDDATFERILKLDSDFKDVQSELACTEEDQKTVKDSCGKQFACNMGRSVVTLVDSMAPRFIANKVRSGLQTVLSPDEGSSCLDEDQPDCLSEIYRSFVGSIVATITSFRDLGRATVSAFSSLKSYLFDKSDDLHKAAETTQEEAVSFMDSPGKYILSKLTKFKDSVDTWIKDTVFCQKWEEDAETKERFCAEPLQGYACLDCDDGVNAFCAGAGFLLSEGLITVATAGTLTGVGVIAKAGATVGGKLMARGAAALSESVPALSRLSRQSKNTATAARRAGLITRARERVSAFSKLLKESRLGRGIAKANEVATFPLRIVDDLSQKTIETVLSGASRVGRRTILGKSIRVTARGDLRAMRLAQRNSDTVLSTAGTTSKGLLGNKAIRLGNRHRTTHRPQGSRDRRNPEAREVGTDRRSERGPDSERDRRDQVERERRDQAERERREREREAERRDDKKDEKDGTSTPPLVSTTRTVVATDLANKSYQALSESFSEELLPSQDVIDGQLTGDSQDLDNNKTLEENLEERTGKSFTNPNQAQTFTQNMNRIYQDKNRKNEVIRRMMDSRGLTRDQAEKVYDSERKFYADAQRKFLSDSERTSNLTAEVKNLKRKIKINDLLAKVKDLRAEIDRSELPTEGSNLDSPVRGGSPVRSGVGDSDIRDGLNISGSGDRRTPSSISRISSGLPFPAVDNFQGEVSDADELPTSEVVEESKNEKEEKKGSDPDLADDVEKPEKEEKRTTDANLNTMEFFSLFLVEVEKDGLSFRNLSRKEKSLIEPVLALNQSSIELDNLKVAKIGEEEGGFFIFFDEENQKTIVLDGVGHHLYQIPLDLI
jgi:hypothetical protein